MNSVGIVIPCFNEGPGIPKLLEILSDSDLAGITFLLVDNGSTDETARVLSEVDLPDNINTLRIEKNQGYGFGIITGLRGLRTDYVGWMHGDLQTSPLELLNFLEDIENECDYTKGIRTGRPLFDRVFTFGMSALLSIMFMRLMKDINAQPNIIKKTLFEKWSNPPYDFSFDLYAYIFAMRNGNKISRRRVFFGRRDWGASTWNSGMKSRLKFIKRTLKIAYSLRINNL